VRTSTERSWRAIAVRSCAVNGTRRMSFATSPHDSPRRAAWVGRFGIIAILPDSSEGKRAGVPPG